MSSQKSKLIQINDWVNEGTTIAQEQFQLINVGKTRGI